MTEEDIYTLEDKADYQLSFIERMVALDTDHGGQPLYDNMQEDLIRAVTQCFRNLDKIQRIIEKQIR